MARIIIAGGTGFVGKKLCQKFINENHEVIVLTRQPIQQHNETSHLRYKQWGNNSKDWFDCIDGADAVINLAGASVAQRWTSDHKRRIFDSRVHGTNALSTAIIEAKNPPAFFFSASAIGYYGNCGDTALNEESPGGQTNDFLAYVCSEWEKSALRAAQHTRVVIGRIGIVLDKNEGALSKMLLPFTLGIGGPLGDGKQWWSWIHPSDVVGIIEWAMKEVSLTGAVNLTAPQPVRMKNFAKELANTLSRPSLFPVPKFVLSLIMGESAVIATHSQNVIPEKALRHGYQFTFTQLSECLSDILHT